MGFYGNITNTSRTSFQFDKTYSSRYVMDQAVASDGVFIGRFVLIEYDKNINKLDYVTAYKRVEGKRPIFGVGFDKNNALNRFIIGTTRHDNVIPDGTVIRVPGKEKDGTNYFNHTYKEVSLTKESYKINTYYIYDGGEFVLSKGAFDSSKIYFQLTYGESDEYYIGHGTLNGEAQFTRIKTTTSDTNSSTYTNYVFNFNLDNGVYGASRGYDSTVWQKVYTDNVQKYVMVAELNSVVPTFDVSADAPTQIPMVPHFDTDSTNVYYKLHWQPAWGLRVKSSLNNLRSTQLNPNGTAINGTSILMSDNLKEYPSDVTTTWVKQEYDPQTGDMVSSYLSYEEPNNDYDNNGIWKQQLQDEEITPIPAAIYFNKAGFNSETISYSGDKDYEGWGKNKKVTDEINVLPTGKSGHQYNPHDGTVDKQSKVDTQELEVMLPSLGDSVAKMWDLVYGGRDTSEGIKKTGRRNTDTNWEDGYAVLNRQGLRMVKDTNESTPYVKDKGDNKYNKAAINTLAGCINSVHDLMGMIIMPKNGAEIESEIENYDTDKIYYSTNTHQYYRKHQTYTYDNIPFTSDNYIMKVVDIDAENYLPGLYYISTATGNNVRPENCSISNDNYDSTKIYYLKQLKKEISDEKVVVDNRLLDFSKGDYWFGENPTGSYIKGDIPFQNYIKDSTYHKGKVYYTIKNPTKEDLMDDYKKGTLYCSYGTRKFFNATLNKEEVWTNGYELCLDEKYDDSKEYYKIKKVYSLKEANFDGIYLPGVFYYKALASSPTREPWDPVENKNDEFVYALDTTLRGTGTETNTTERTHYAITTESASGGNNNTYILVTEYRKITLTEKNYVKNKYYYYVNGNATSISYNLFKDVPENIRNNAYEKILVYKRADTETVIINENNPLQLRPYDESEQWYKRKIDNKTGEITYGLLDISNVDRSCTEDYYTFVNPIDKSQVGIEKVNRFYTPSKYYYKITDKNSEFKDSYLIDNQEHIERDENVTDFYYTINPNSITKIGGADKFFDPTTYYDENGNLVTTKPANGTTIYKKRNVYVVEDSLGQYPKGTPWSKDILFVPASITLGIRDDAYDAKPLEGFADTLNTIHGLILRINNVLESGDELTRNTDTVQGCINSIKDILVKIDALKPSEMVVIDAYGRIHSAKCDTRQMATADIFKETNRDDGVKGDKFAKTASLESMKNQWLTLYINDNPSEPKLILRHNFQPVEDTSNASNLNDANTNTINLYTPIVDKMGHVVGKNTKTVTLPYGFKKVISNGRGNSVAINTGAVSSSTLTAKNTQDSLTINSGNKWVRIDGDANTNSLSISHDVHSFSNGKANTNYGLTSSKSIQELDSNNTFTIPYFQFDEAGHIISAGNNTVTVPEVFATIKVSTSTDIGNSTAGIAGSCVADSLQDTLTLAEGNKWINLVADEVNDKITFYHYAQAFTQSTQTTNFNDASVGNTFAIQVIEWDEAGHLTSSIKNTFTLPNAFSSVKIGSSSSTEVTEIAAANGAVNASAIKDEITFNVGNRWLKAKVDGKTITFAHAAPDTRSSSTSSSMANTQTPSFGNTFNIPVIKYDQMGHIFSVGTTTVKIPNITFTGGIGNVVTELTYNNGAFTLSKANIGTLAITGYTAVTNGHISATDSLNSALNKLDSAITSEISNRQNAINSLGMNEISADTGEIISSIKQTNGLVSATSRKLTKDDITPLLTDYSTSDQIANVYVTKDSLGTMSSKNSDSYYTKTEIDNKGYFTSADTYTKAEIDDKGYLTKDSTLEYSQNDITSTTITIQALAKKVAELEAKIAQLTPTI